jgi:hypothetical protein
MLLATYDAHPRRWLKKPNVASHTLRRWPPSSHTPGQGDRIFGPKIEGGPSKSIRPGRGYIMIYLQILPFRELHREKFGDQIAHGACPHLASGVENGPRSAAMVSHSRLAFFNFIPRKVTSVVLNSRWLLRTYQSDLYNLFFLLLTGSVMNQGIGGSTF